MRLLMTAIIHIFCVLASLKVGLQTGLFRVEIMLDPGPDLFLNNGSGSGSDFDSELLFF